jgi:acetyl-CoA carboxylase biotin carboxyl carrier protein
MRDTDSDRADDRDEARREADHAAIDRLAGELVRALAARLEASGMAEIEVTEGGGRVRVRRSAPAGDSPEAPSAATDGSAAPGRAVPGLVAVGPGSRDGGAGRERASRSTGREPASSPAVGYFSPRDGLHPGLHVTAGERIGSVDVLGVGHEVTSPMDGVVAEILIEPGQAVEYGQRLVTVERVAHPHDMAVSEA